MKFSKLQGAGNDFILINGFVEKSDNWNEVAKKVCDRHFGVGADGMIFCSESEIADVKMNFYNADGSRAAMCGNGIRCFTKFVYENKIVQKDIIAVETDNGIKNVKLIFDEDKNIKYLQVDLNKIEFYSLNEEVDIEGRKIILSSTLMGVPHAVIEVDDFANFDVNELGRKIEILNDTNVNFIKKIDESTLEIRTWERGAGRTLGCGTGSSAAAAVAKKLGITSGDKITTLSAGGELIIKLDSDYNVTLIGGASLICEGNLAIITSK